MLTLNTIKENPEEVIRRLAIKNFDATQVIARVLELDKTRRNTQASLDSSLAELKTLSATIGQLVKEEKKGEAEDIEVKTGEIKEAIK